MPNHGEYDPGRGWYSAVHGGWLNDPKKIGRVVAAPDVEHKRGEYERMTTRDFKAQPHLDRLLELRDSDRPDDRAKFDSVMRGSARMTLHDYEAAKSKAAESEGA
jgi:hypothetical protein